MFISGIRFLEVTDTLLPKLSCSICQYYISCPPIYVNQGSQQICHRCYEAKDLTGFVRHIALETLLQIVVFPCIYRNWGCPTKEHFGENSYVHELDCSYGLSYKKVPFKKTSVTKDGRLKERGLVESHRGPVWATITPQTILFGQGKIKLTSQLSYNNDHMDPNKQQVILSPSMLKPNGRIPIPEEDYDLVGENPLRKKSDKSDYSTNPSVHQDSSVFQYPPIHKVDSSASFNSSNVVSVEFFYLGLESIGVFILQFSPKT